MSSTEFELRPACATDLDLIYALNETVMRAHVEATRGKWDADFQRGYFTRAFSDAKHDLIRVVGAFAGCVAVERSASHIAINRVLLLPEFQNRGIGSELPRRLVAESINDGKPLRLSVVARNQNALRLYRGFGSAVVDSTLERISMERTASIPVVTGEHR